MKEVIFNRWSYLAPLGGPPSALGGSDIGGIFMDSVVVRLGLTAAVQRRTSFASRSDMGRDFKPFFPWGFDPGLE